MKSLNLFFLFFLLSSFGALQAQDSTHASPLKGPHIIFTEMHFDTGPVGDDTTITHIFIFSNTGKDTLHIKGVKPG